jgi:Ca2+-binding RTX toxin-like protein
VRSILLAALFACAAPAAASAATVTADGTVITYQSRSAAAVRVYAGIGTSIVLRSSEPVTLTGTGCWQQSAQNVVPVKLICAGTHLSVDLSPFADQLWVTGLPDLDTTAYGHGGDDLMLTGTGDDELHGGLGDDYLNGRLGTNLVYGGLGTDTCLNGTFTRCP